MKKLLTVICFALVAVFSQAANHYVREGASGAANGNDWTDAWTQLPSVLTRGDTYFFAAGNYDGYTFNDADSGTSRITIQKATVASHGTSTGWSDVYATGQAVFGGFGIEVGYITIDGAYEYGIKLSVPEGGYTIYLGGSSPDTRTGITFTNVEMAGPAGAADYFWTLRTVGIYGALYNGAGSSATYFDDMVISHCSIHGFETLMQTANTRGMIIEYTYFYDSRTSNPDGQSPHPNVAYIQAAHNTTFRFNDISNFGVVGLYPVYTSTGYWRVYGNYFHDSGAGLPQAFIPSGVGPYVSFEVYNNTFRNITFLSVNMTYISSGTYAGGFTNNLFENFGDTLWGAAAHDYNWYSGASAYSEANGIAGGAANPFSAAPQINQSISSTLPRNKGSSSPAAFNVDKNGTVRGSDGLWDIGAYEYYTAARSMSGGFVSRGGKVSR